MEIKDNLNLDWVISTNVNTSWYTLSTLTPSITSKIWSNYIKVNWLWTFTSSMISWYTKTWITLTIEFWSTWAIIEHSVNLLLPWWSDITTTAWDKLVIINRSNALSWVTINYIWASNRWQNTWDETKTTIENKLVWNITSHIHNYNSIDLTIVEDIWFTKFCRVWKIDWPITGTSLITSSSWLYLFDVSTAYFTQTFTMWAKWKIKHIDHYIYLLNKSISISCSIIVDWITVDTSPTYNYSNSPQNTLINYTFSSNTLIEQGKVVNFVFNYTTTWTWYFYLNVSNFNQYPNWWFYHNWILIPNHDLQAYVYQCEEFSWLCLSNNTSIDKANYIWVLNSSVSVWSIANVILKGWVCSW